MADPADLTERIARQLYDARREFYVPAWDDTRDDHAMKQTCLEDARIAVEVVGEGERMAEENRIDVTTVPPGALERMAKSDARPSPKLQAAIERVRQRLRREIADRVIEKPHCEPVPDPRDRWYDSKPETRETGTSDGRP